ncbi:hypothetical protein BU23DRAFT_574981 [Bimuria novae-zelandiae CBS 107.79]|uniref:Uncharacterized protein n=1 Tax=Bimuria novae-zelandiae CBS 107.79 TaxID=1447943 RepID=A0A6A5ULY1_9PLEO|nr:hypothetical protein BU23DRAFT_574981 [Bimuria novae-zelandiae CBS 107.79]
MAPEARSRIGKGKFMVIWVVPALTCLPPGTGPTPPGGIDPNDPSAPIVPIDPVEDPVDEEEEEYCLIRSSERPTKTVGVTVTATSLVTTVALPKTTTSSTTAKPPPPPKKTPNFDNDEVKCYDSRQWTRRAHMISTADVFCERALAEHTL